jgi:hypothetical protein
MSQGNDLAPPQDAGVEYENIGFDFGPALAANETITSVLAMTCSADSGYDPSAQSRLSGTTSIVTSVATSIASQQVNTQIGFLLGNVTYLLQCVVQTSASQKLSLYTHLPSDFPT